MSQLHSLHFKDRTISSLVHELNNLGDHHVAIHPTTLIAIQDTETESVRRFRSKSLTRSPANSRKREDNVLESEFFLTDGSHKKFYYNECAQELETPLIASMMNKFEQGFNITVVIEFSLRRYEQIMRKIQPWFQDEFNHENRHFLAYFLEYGVRQASDLLSRPRPKCMPLVEAVENTNQTFYEVDMNALLKVNCQNNNMLKILTLTKNHLSNKFRLILLPSEILSSQVDDPSLKIVRSQLNQILNLIKTYPQKKYENINKLLPKRYPTTTALAQILLYDSANYVINWVGDNIKNKKIVNGRFDFFDRLAGVSNLIKLAPPLDKNRRVFKNSSSINKQKLKGSRSPISHRSHKCQSEIQEGKTRAKVYVQESNISSTNQLQFCRTFERKTHKYSIHQQDPLFPQNLKFSQLNSENLNENEAIIVLKAQHARQISQYHETIQNLNSKILILSSQKGLSELYTIHQRQIMLLELKIQELRKNISSICSAPSKSKETQNLKQIIKKLNEEVLHWQKNSPAHKLAQGKIKILQKEMREVQVKLKKSEDARQQLSLQLQAMTNRLKIKDHECGDLKQKQVQKYEDSDLAIKDMTMLKQIEQILSNNKLNKSAKEHLLRKMKNILGDFSELRQIILQCNNFLVDLQDHIQSRLGVKDPDVVLDCNRFIRNYLLNNLNIF